MSKLGRSPAERKQVSFGARAGAQVHLAGAVTQKIHLPCVRDAKKIHLAEKSDAKCVLSEKFVFLAARFSLRTSVRKYDKCLLRQIREARCSNKLNRLCSKNVASLWVHELSYKTPKESLTSLCFLTLGWSSLCSQNGR